METDRDILKQQLDFILRAFLQVRVWQVQIILIKTRDSRVHQKNTTLQGFNKKTGKDRNSVY